MYIVYGGFCVVGFMTWLRIERRERTEVPVDGVAVSGGGNRRLTIRTNLSELSSGYEPCSVLTSRGRRGH